jgi:hypothetical protein
MTLDEMSKLRKAAQAVLHAIEHGHPNGTQGMDATLDALHDALVDEEAEGKNNDT